jgi:hypothetical protein
MPSPHVRHALKSRILGALTAALASAMLVAPAYAAPFSYGELKGSFDSTFSVGALYRLNNPSPTYYGTTNSFNGVAGLQTSVNADDGNLNYKKGTVSQLLKGSHDLELRYRNFGGFARGYYFRDLKAGNTARTPLTDQAQERVEKGAELLDAYVLAKFDAADSIPVDLRFGRQVLSLGESTFIPNGINIINPVDLSKLRVPGAELKEAFLPVNMLKASIGLTQNLTIEPFWLLEFRRNEIEPAGTYFSTNDFASRGGKNVFLGFGSLADNGTLGGIPRDLDREGGNFNQYGVAARYTAAALNDTDLGFYYAKYHSRSPLISSRTPTAPINTDLTGPLTAVFIRSGLPAATAAAQASGIFQLIVLSQTNPAALTPVQIATLQAAQTQAAINGARSIALLTAAATGRYFIEYPEGVDLFGVSFNTALGKTGISWQGEFSYKKDQPLQIDDVELLFATLSSLNPAFGANNQIGNYLGQLGRELSGFRRHNVSTAQTTLTKVFGPLLGSQQFTLLGEVGGVWADLPSKDFLRYDGPGTFTSANAATMINTGNGAFPPTPSSAFADEFSWGYQVAGRLDYTNVFANVNISPSLAFTHDVSGNTPLPLGNYVAKRKSVNLGVEFTYQQKWSLELRYVNFFDGDRYNLLADRDYVSTTLRYSF